MTPKDGQNELPLNGRKKKHFATVSYAVLTETARDLGKKPVEIAKKLGYSASVVTGWMHANTIPKVAGVACEGLRRRFRNAASHPKSTLLVYRVPADKREAVVQFANAIGLELKGEVRED